MGFRFFIGDSQGHIARAGGQVQDQAGADDFDAAGRGFSPEPVPAQAGQVIEAVVTRGDAAEYARYQRSELIRVDINSPRTSFFNLILM